MNTLPKTFLDYGFLRELSGQKAPDGKKVDEILGKAIKLKGLDLTDAASLLAVEKKEHLEKILLTAEKVKKEIYGNRMVLFAPLYAGNKCSNNCLYCAFRRENSQIKRVTLTMDEIKKETEMLLAQGHKRVLLLTGESAQYPMDYTVDAIKAVYGARSGNSSVRRVNVEIAPADVSDFRKLKTAKIGTYTCFQETYDPELYPTYHPSGKKADYEYRLYVMDRAMEAGIDDVGIGALFGLADYRFEVLSLFMHASHLEKKFGCGPHTVSVPRIEPAPGAPLTENVPFPVSDDDFRKIIAVIRITLPYTGIILSTREPASLRKELFHYGVSQVSGGSKTNPGGYTEKKSGEEAGQFTLGDHRSLEEVISGLVDDSYIPSFCTGCYRRGRVGADFMDLAKPGLIKQYCMPNGIISFAEYLIDYAGEETRNKGFALIKELISHEENSPVRSVIEESLEQVLAGKRDIYL